jgi:hypothetical protein
VKCFLDQELFFRIYNNQKICLEDGHWICRIDPRIFNKAVMEKEEIISEKPDIGLGKVH